jgi:microcystin-dependent protein
MPWTPPHRTVEDTGVTRNFESLSGQVDALDTAIQAAQTAAVTAVPVGSLNAYVGSAAPAGWLLCDGEPVSQTTYSALFAIIGTAYNTGSEGSGNFRLPNLKGRVPVGLDASQSEFDARGETGGSKTHLLTDAQMPYHRHGFTPSGSISGTVDNHQHTNSGTFVTGLSFNVLNAVRNDGNQTAVVRNLTNTTATVASTGSTQPGFSGSFTGTAGNSAYAGGSGGVTEAHPNLSPYLVVTFIIKT